MILSSFPPKIIFVVVSEIILVKFHFTTKHLKCFILYFTLISIKNISTATQPSLIKPRALIIFCIYFVFLLIILIVNSCNAHVFYFCILGNKFDLYWTRTFSRSWLVDKMTSWRNDKLTKWQVDKMTSWQIDKLTSWQIDKLTKWQVDKMTSWQIDKLTKWQVDKMTSWKNYKLTKWQVDKMT